MEWKAHIEVQTAEGCAWRAVYLHVNGRQVAHLGVDPCLGVRPTAFGSVKLGRLGRSFQLSLPHVPWKNDISGLRLQAYRLSQWFWSRVDGRFGWGTQAIK